MGILYIDRKNLEIKIIGNALKFYINGRQEGSVPLSPLDKVVIIGNLKFETSVLHKLAQKNISVIFLSGRRLTFRCALHGRLHNNGLLRLKQYEKSQSLFALFFAIELIKNKLQKQVILLSELRTSCTNHSFKIKSSISSIEEIIKKLDKQDNIDSLRGLEGGAANRYFKALSFVLPNSLNFKGRVKRPPGDPVNALLSLGYTMLHFEMVREIEVIGLDPVIGFYHCFEYGRESLACDLVEPFRPDIDRFVLNIFREKIFKKNDFFESNENGSKGYYLKKNKRKQYFDKYEEWAVDQRPKWREQVRILAWRVLNG